MIKKLLLKTQMHKAIIFDLDDTLYKEVDYVKSGFNVVSEYISREIGCSKTDIYGSLFNYFIAGNNVFDKLIDGYNLNIDLKDLLELFRLHKPEITLDKKTKCVLDELNESNLYMGLLTDGRSIQQRNKIESLGISNYFKDIIISEEIRSEKPTEKNYSIFMNSSSHKDTKYFYIGDNTSKDFISPNQLGWKTICLKDNGQNIHKQNFDLDKKFLPENIINELSEILDII